MVFVNDKKFACESCIKGHRSSSCHHTERPLFEVKKKGRPVSQCPKCRELRQAKRVHSKCTCAPQQAAADKVPIPAARPDRKPRRFMPSVPSLPNGISDALQSNDVLIPPNSRQRVDSLLNPCHCKSVRQCNCRSANVAESSSCHERPPHLGLKTLADAAAMFREQPIRKASNPCSSESFPSSCCADKRTPRHIPTLPYNLNLPPILNGSNTSFRSVPDFSVMPPLSTIKSIAGSGCTCGLRCACPGCVEHRGPEHALKEHNACGEGCGHCVDHAAGIELPGQDLSSSGGSLVDIFFARAASLPNPPTIRRSGMDPGNVTVYPSELFSGSSRDVEERGVAFGLVKIPKLECCGGQCGCPSDGCQCGQSCNGCCGNHHAVRQTRVPVP
ncbi:hypothetical protein HYDPIDRAFT_147486 [Hydnomerulius pinastri MD-312]|nr:hypothetical protein HYDPIDRAFT_147486 [Hydnomerulius pinastri MD-312]